MQPSSEPVKQPQRVTFSVYTPNTLAQKISKKNPEAGRVRKFYASASEPTLQRNESNKPKRTRSASPPPRPVSFKFHQFVISKDSPRGSFQTYEGKEQESSLHTKVAAKPQPQPNRPARHSRDEGRPAGEPLAQQQPNADNSPYQLEVLNALTSLSESQQAAVVKPPSPSPSAQPAPAQQAHHFAAQSERKFVPEANQTRAVPSSNTRNVQHTPAEMNQDEISQIVQLLQNQQFQTRSPQPQNAMRLPSMHLSPQSNSHLLPSMQPHNQLPRLADLHIQNEQFVLPPLSAMQATQALPDPLAHFRSSPNTIALPKPIQRMPM
jgi:hypothetical protein